MSLLERILGKLSDRGTSHEAEITASQNKSASFKTESSSHELLLSLCRSRQLLEVLIDNRGTSFQSMILAVDTERGMLWLDQLTPSTLALMEGQSLTLRHQRHSEVLTLRLPVISDQSQSRNAIAVLLPSKVEYRPRRSWLRYEPGYDSLKATIRTIGNAPTEANIVNISGGGMRLRLKGNQLHSYRRDAHLPLCQVRLSHQIQVNCQAKVKSVRLVREPFRHTQVSLEFTDMTPSARIQLNNQLSNLLNITDANQTLDAKNELQLVG
ncbi:flagellar brake protein [Gilvimarinus agarilyticus]|uniref:flagellar brake protein n=1 Tax=unclassified Gilvimarinus TaxID=2642066 RepID=UPI001C08C78D|nr:MULTISPECIES: flagellar brake protein [unclassified Gilvimarinus]MBU2887269.1 flagellar brake protein [Gilvimarinus agarilyticus]MDO6571928.1 flagellar brake protein [Gilvimarinus sp. 2_MG-2023]MDO6745997.1 flagellar brake protein [Gilvimarinus sp. 1_MG-2023]